MSGKYLGFAGLKTPSDPLRGERPVEHRPRSYFGDDTVHQRTPAAVREVIEHRLSRWFYRHFTALPPDIGREERIDRVFVAQGWQVRACVKSTLRGRWPLHGWLMTRPNDGYLTYVDRSRDGDMGTGWEAPTSGSFGVRPALFWAEDLTDLLGRNAPPFGTDGFEIAPRPAPATAQVLAAHAYDIASPAERETAAFLLSLGGADLPALLGAVSRANIPVLRT